MQATVFAQQLFLVNSDLIPAALFSMNFSPVLSLFMQDDTW